MKKRIITATVVIIVFVSGVLYFLPSVHQKEVLILSPIIHAARELNSPAEWQRWNPYLKKYCIENPGACAVSGNTALGTFTIKAPPTSISVASHGAFFDIEQTGDNGDFSCNYALIPSRHDDSTKLIVTEKRSLLVSLLSFSPSSMAIADADSLKNFLETPSDYYGFPLTISTVVDTCVVVMHKRVAAANRATELANMYGSMYSFIKTNLLTVTQPCIAHYQPVGKDSVDITAGIPVDKTVKQGHEKNSFSFMEMPSKGKMIVGYYRGKFGDRIKLYRAMDRYMTDKLMKIVALPYEKYLNNTVPANDSSLAEIKVYYPVF